jgi:hypothetical protein
MPTTADAIQMRGFWQMMPDRRSMSFQRRVSVGPPPSYDPQTTIVNCWHRNFSTVSHPGNPGVYVLQSCEIYVPRVPNAEFDIASERPNPGDIITDGSSTSIPFTDTTWFVESCTDVGALGAWKLGCVAPTIVSSESISVKFQNPTETISTAGQRVVTGWSDISTVSVWVQLVNTQADDLFGCRTMARNATVYTSAYPTITAQSTVLEVVSGRRYTIKEYRPARNLNELNEYELELIP